MVTKKNATREVFDFTKIVSAVAKSAARIGKDLTDDKIERLLDEINKFLLPE
ncbi:MAG: ATP cone domain-containing protein, partial [Cetobacterium sp.]